MLYILNINYYFFGYIVMPFTDLYSGIVPCFLPQSKVEIGHEQYRDNRDIHRQPCPKPFI